MGVSYLPTSVALVVLGWRNLEHINESDSVNLIHDRDIWQNFSKSLDHLFHVFKVAYM